MRISNVTYLPIAEKLREPLILSVGEIRERPFALLRIETADGYVGYGEAFTNFPPWSIYEKVHTFERGLKPLLAGEDPTNIERLWWRMYKALYRWGIIWGKGAIMQAISAVDIALWDIKGRVLGAPIYELLGGLYRERIPLYATGVSPRNPEDHASKLVSEGYRALKLRVGMDMRRDVEMVGRVREAVGYEVDLMVDANMAWSFWEALEMAKKLGRYRVFWLEEPVRVDDYELLRRVSARIDIPIAAGENSYDLVDFRGLLASGVGYLMPDVSKVGGFTGILRVLPLAEEWNVRCSPHYYGSDLGFAASLHVMASRGVCFIIQRDVSQSVLREAVLKTPIRVEGGYAYVPRGPGLGVDVDEDVVEDHLLT